MNCIISIQEKLVTYYVLHLVFAIQGNLIVRIHEYRKSRVYNLIFNRIFSIFIDFKNKSYT